MFWLHNRNQVQKPSNYYLNSSLPTIENLQNHLIFENFIFTFVFWRNLTNRKKEEEGWQLVGTMLNTGQQTMACACHMYNLVPTNEQGVCHTVALPFTLKSIWREIFFMETQIFHHAKQNKTKPNLQKETKILQHIIIILL
jgi:hypothetical protein